MRELSLFTGAGGGLLGTHLLGWTPIGYVEWDAYCQRVIAARIADGYLPAAPIFGDVRQFVQSGAAREYRGFADVVTAGFPCQPFSVAGKQRGADDERNMWPATRDTIRDVRPAHVMLENVPGLIACGYLGIVLADLAALGYVGRWGVLGADDVGAPHRRKRLWIVAHAEGESSDGSDDYGRGDSERAGKVSELGNSRGDAPMADADSPRLSDNRGRSTGGERARNGTAGRCSWWDADPADVPDAELIGRGSLVAPDASGTRNEGLASSSDASSGSGSSTEPAMGRVAYGVPNRVDRLRAIGNAQVGSVAARAWRLLA